MKEIEHPTIEQIEECLKKINWSFYNAGCDFKYLKNHNGEVTDWCVLKDRIELREEKYITCYFSLKSTKLKLLDNGDAVAFTAIGSDNDVFLLCMNTTLRNPPHSRQVRD